MKESDYVKLLKKARKELPKHVFEESRFVIPKISSMISGKKTELKNINQVAKQLDRSVVHLVKFLSKDLGTNFIKEGDRYVFYGKFSSILLNQKLNKYLKEFVYCDECKKPDSVLRKEGRITFLKCNACGARRSVRTL